MLLVFFLNASVSQTILKYSFDDGTYSHAYLIPFITIYLFYSLNQSSSQLVFRKNISSYASILFLIAVCFLFITTKIQFSLGYLLSVLLVFSASVTMVIRSNAKIIFASLYFIFLLPVWSVLTVPLQQLSIKAVSVLIAFTNIPVYIESTFVHIPSGTFEIAGGCSGLRYLLVSLAISSLYIFLNIRVTYKAVILICFAILGALLTNWLRIVALIIIGDQSEMTSSLMEDHNSFGWYFYLPFIILLFMLGDRLRDNTLHESSDKLSKKASKKIISKPSFLIISIVVFILILTSTFFQSLFQSSLQNKDALVNDSKEILAPTIHNYTNLFVKKIKNLSINSTYHIYSYESFNLDAKPTFFKNNYLLTGWHVEREFFSRKWKIFKLKKQGVNAIVAYSYRIGDYQTSNSTLHKGNRLKSIFFNNKPLELHWLFTNCENDCENEVSVIKGTVVK